MFYTMLALCEEGDEVLYPDPGFPMYESIAAFAGAVPVPVPLREENEFRVDPEEVEQPRHPAHEAPDPQLAAQPLRQRPHPRRLRGASPRSPSATT